MNAEIMWDQKRKSLEFQNVNIFLGCANSGKTSLAKYLENVFKGNEKEASIDHLPVGKKQFNVRYISKDMNFSDELKLTSKSLITQVINETIDQEIIEESQYALEQINKQLKIVERKLNQKFSFIKKSYSQSYNISLSYDNLFDLIKSNFTLIDFDQTQSSILRFLTIEGSIRLMQPQILIIDDFDNDLDLGQMLVLLELFKNTPETYVFLFTKSPSLTTSLYNLYSTYLVEYKLSEIHAFMNSFFDILLYEEISVLGRLVPLYDTEEKMFINKNYLSLYLNDFCTFLSLENKKFYYQFFRKNKLVDEKTLKVFKKFLEFCDSKSENTLNL